MDAFYIETYDDFVKRVIDRAEERAPDELSARLIGLLFMRAGQGIVDKEIIPSFEYFDRRSGDDIDFHIPGWKRVHAYGIGMGREPTLKFDAENFIKACDIFASETRWTYSGGVDLLLFTLRRIGPEHWEIDLGGVIVIPILELREKKLVESTDVLFERIFSFARKFKGRDPILGFSTQEARVSAVNGLIETLVGYLPKEAKERLQYAKNFRIQDVSRPGVRAVIGIQRMEQSYGNPDAV
jgi:hypothetical protein